MSVVVLIGSQIHVHVHVHVYFKDFKDLIGKPPPHVSHPLRETDFVHLHIKPGWASYQRIRYFKVCTRKYSIFLSGSAGDVGEEWKEPRHLCHIVTTGVYPSLSVTDARCYGSAATISKKQLWSFFSLDK